MAAPGTRLPIAPLEVIACSHLGRARPIAAPSESCDPRLASVADMADLVGVTRRSWTRWRQAGTIPLDSADRAAVALGRHPSEIWGFEFHEAGR